MLMYASILPCDTGPVEGVDDTNRTGGGAVQRRAQRQRAVRSCERASGRQQSGHQREGFRIEDILANTPASNADVQAGDIITHWNGVTATAKGCEPEVITH